MTLFLQYLASGIATGCAYALVATGFVAIYRVTLPPRRRRPAWPAPSGRSNTTRLGHAR
ncbi:MAG: hypothetical protein M3024_13070 [Candidatus Dormibacteraeota bacterium]|nr:hypothetical protein [Candidatus Dormibacteraeota bacterium]